MNDTSEEVCYQCPGAYEGSRATISECSEQRCEQADSPTSRTLSLIKPSPSLSKAWKAPEKHSSIVTLKVTPSKCIFIYLDLYISHTLSLSVFKCYHVSS